MIVDISTDGGKRNCILDYIECTRAYIRCRNLAVTDLRKMADEEGQLFGLIITKPFELEGFRRRTARTGRTSRTGLTHTRGN